MTKPEFTYVTPFSAPIRFGVGGLLTLAGVAGVVVFVIAAITSDSKTVPIIDIAVAALLILIGIYVVSMRVFVRADDSSVTIGLTPWPTSTFRWSEVESVEKVDISFFKAMGIGYRITGAKSRAVLAKPGKGLRFQLKDGRSLSVVCDDKRDELAILAASHA